MKIEKDLPIQIKEVNEIERSFWAVASTETVDRYGDIVEQNGWEFDNFLKNPVIPWGHNYSQPAIAKVAELKVVDGKLYFKAQFPKKGTYELADIVFELYKEGILNAFSVGFIPKEYQPNEFGGYTYKKSELLEISAVTVPANQEALILTYKSLMNKDNKNKEGEKKMDSNEEKKEDKLLELEERIKNLEDYIEKQKEEDERKKLLKDLIKIWKEEV
ncbi:hypothetical protein LN42_00560 [Marinitoga sp. 1137]|uniref:HK97 family phage prohead protease n=1 Tax=Marinitoga sp. 1137 TaxID=1545835 RepID=UPI00095084D8|nr:HK97 family phage prohead protease [Marinitoga sp. 1137]APT75052.1 hypothetical protein LN42_00560 [Marinitoga sp. 1137]